MAGMRSNWARQELRPAVAAPTPEQPHAAVGYIPPSTPAPAAPAATSWFDQPRATAPVVTTAAPTTATAPAAPTTQGSPATNQGDPLARIEQLQGQYQPTPEGFRQILAQLQQEGYPVVAATHNGGTEMSDDAIVLPNGAVYDIISSVGSPNASWSLQHTDNYDPSRNVVAPNGEMQSFSSYLQGAGLPASTAVPFARPSGGGGGGVMSLAGAPSGSVAAGVPGFTTAGSNWQAGMDPSYDFRFGEGLKALQRSSAARGTLLSGGTLAGLMRYGQGMASQEFGNIFDRNTQLAQLGLNATNSAANLGSSYSGQLGNQASNFGNEIGNLANNQAGNLGNLTSGQINALVGLITGQGNTNAAGQVGGANSWRGSIADLTNIFGQALANQPRQNG